MNKEVFMKKIILSALLAVSLSSAVSAQEATVTDQAVFLDGKQVEVQGYNIDGSNYFKLRDIAAVLKDTEVGFDVGFNKDTNNITIQRFSKYTPLSSDLTKSDSKEIQIQPAFQQARVDNDKVKYNGYLINGNNYFKLRDLGKNLGFVVDYNEAERKVLIKPEKVEPKDLTSREEVKLVNLTSALSSNTKDLTLDKDSISVYDFTKNTNIIGRTDDGKQHALEIEYLEDENVLLLTPIQLKFKGSLRLTPVVKVEQDGKSETFILKSKNIKLNSLPAGINKDTNFVLTLGYHEGESTFKGLSVINIKGGLK